MSHDRRQILSRCTDYDTHNQLAVLIVYHPLLYYLSKRLNFSYTPVAYGLSLQT